MNHKQKTSVSIPALIEIIFDTAYLIFAITAGSFMLFSASPGDTSLLLYGSLALVLGFGDAFHLLPRIQGHLHGDMASRGKALGLGKLVTSITMTVFYLLLYGIWSGLYGTSLVGDTSIVPIALTALIALAALRIALCLCPQNRWFSTDAPLRWGIYRNIPFLIMGGIIIGLFARTSWVMQDAFRFMPLAVLLSFLFYIPVVLFSKKIPALGSLMLPKTAAYIWIISMGFHLL